MTLFPPETASPATTASAYAEGARVSVRPPWLKVGLPKGPAYQRLKQSRRTQGLATVCEEAQCPNIGDCWTGGTATFMVMGDVCTRGCRFCAVATGMPMAPPDPEEPGKLATAIAEAGWSYVVITAVDRDDLPDGGAAHMAQCLIAIRQQNPAILIEALIPDFQGDMRSLHTLLDAQPDVLAHNVETVERLTPAVRDRRAGYHQSLALLGQAKSIMSSSYGKSLLTKSSLMLGLGESSDELHQAMADLRTRQVDVLTLGQYLQPGPKQLPVRQYLSPDVFAYWQHVAETQYRFAYCASGPLVRSSYKAGDYALIQLLKTR